MRPLRGFGGLLMFTVLMLTSTYGAVFMVTPVFLLLLVKGGKKYFQTVTDYMLSLYFALAVALIELVLGVKVRVTGGHPRAGQRSIIMMNHRTRLDWLFYWCALWRSGGLSALSKEKIVLKRSLKFIPGAGWAMQAIGYLFLARHWETDRKYLDHVLSYFCDNGPGDYHTLLFPEGTDYEPDTVASSDKFADKTGVPRYEFVLHPRVTGAVYLIQWLRGHGVGTPCVHDVTVAYPGSDADGVTLVNPVPHTAAGWFVSTELEVVGGSLPSVVHFHTDTYHYNGTDSLALPQDEEGIKEWCVKLWESKEEKLRKYYSCPAERRVFCDSNHVDLSSGSGDTNANYGGVVNGNGRTGNGSSDSLLSSAKKESFVARGMNNKTYEGPPNTPVLYVILVYWTVFVSVCTYALLTLWFVRMWFLLAAVCYWGLMVGYGGLELWLSRSHKPQRHMATSTGAQMKMD